MNDHAGKAEPKNLAWYIRTIAAGVANEARNGFVPLPEEPNPGGVPPGPLPSQYFQVASVLFFSEGAGDPGRLTEDWLKGPAPPVCLPATDRHSARFAAAVASASRETQTRGRYVVMLSSGAVAETGDLEWNPHTGVAVVHAPGGPIGYSARDLAGLPREA